MKSPDDEPSETNPTSSARQLLHDDRHIPGHKKKYMLNLVSGERTLGSMVMMRGNGNSLFFFSFFAGLIEEELCIQMDQHVNDPGLKRKEGKYEKENRAE